MSDYKSSEDLTYSHKELQQAELAEMAAIADVAIKLISSLSLNSFLRKLMIDLQKEQRQNAPSGVDIKISPSETSPSQSNPWPGVYVEMTEAPKLSSSSQNLGTQEQKKLPGNQGDLYLPSFKDSASFEGYKSQLNTAKALSDLAQLLHQKGYEFSDINIAIKQGKYYENIIKKKGIEGAAQSINFLIKGAIRKVNAHQKPEKVIQQEKQLESGQKKQSESEQELFLER